MNKLMSSPTAPPIAALRFALPMRGNTTPMHAARWLLAVCLTTAAPVMDGGIAFGRGGEGNEPAAAATQPPPTGDRPDFLFGQPRGMVGISGGWLRAEGGSKDDGLLRFFRDELTIGERGYDALLFRFAFGASVASRVDLVFDVDVSQARTVSEYEGFTEGGLPIAQTTELLQVPLNVGVRYWVAPRGRRVGRLAWVPNTLAVHVGIGGGARRYRLRQFGDFVFRNNEIRTERYESQGWAMSGHVAGGVSIRLSRQVFAVAELRRVWSRKDLAGDFINIGRRLDLDGLQMTGGIEFVF